MPGACERRSRMRRARCVVLSAVMLCGRPVESRFLACLRFGWSGCAPASVDSVDDVSRSGSRAVGGADVCTRRPRRRRHVSNRASTCGMRRVCVGTIQLSCVECSINSGEEFRDRQCDSFSSIHSTRSAAARGARASGSRRSRKSNFAFVFAFLASCLVGQLGPSATPCAGPQPIRPPTVGLLHICT